MATGDVTTRSKNGQWVNEIEGSREQSRSFSSREEAIAAGNEYAAAHRVRHDVHDSEPTGSIVDGGAPDEPDAVSGDDTDAGSPLPDTTDDEGKPLDNPSG